MGLLTEEVRQFLRTFQVTDLKNDPLPIKVHKGTVTQGEIAGQAVQWTMEYLNNRVCPLNLIQFVTKVSYEEIVTQVIVKQAMANSYGGESDDDNSSVSVTDEFESAVGIDLDNNPVILKKMYDKVGNSNEEGEESTMINNEGTMDNDQDNNPVNAINQDNNMITTALNGSDQDNNPVVLPLNGCNNHDNINPFKDKNVSELLAERDIEETTVCLEAEIEPLKLMHIVVEVVDKVCLKLKDINSEKELSQQFQSYNPEAWEGFKVSYYGMKNKRRTMEDKMVVLPNFQEIFKIDQQLGYFAVLDGHNGIEAAIFGAAQLHQFLLQILKENPDLGQAIPKAFKQTDEAFMAKCNKEQIRSGSTIATVLVTKDKLYVAWAGDCMVSLHFGNGQAKQLVSGHRPEREDERARIKSMGGEVVQLNDQYRVNGTLAVTRALGDADFKECVIADPEIIEIERSDLKEEYVVLGSDGLWDYMPVEELGEFVNQLIMDNQASIVAQELAKKAKVKGSTDNISVIVVFLESPETLATKIKERKDQKVVVYEGLLGKHTDSYQPKPTTPLQESNVSQFYTPCAILNSTTNTTLIESPTIEFENLEIVYLEQNSTSIKHKDVSPKLPNTGAEVVFTPSDNGSSSNPKTVTTPTTTTKPRPKIAPTAPTSGLKPKAGVAPKVTTKIVPTTTKSPTKPIASKIAPTTTKSPTKPIASKIAPTVVAKPPPKSVAPPAANKSPRLAGTTSRNVAAPRLPTGTLASRPATSAQPRGAGPLSSRPPTSTLQSRPRAPGPLQSRPTAPGTLQPRVPGNLTSRPSSTTQTRPAGTLPPRLPATTTSRTVGALGATARKPTAIGVTPAPLPRVASTSRATVPSHFVGTATSRTNVGGAPPISTKAATSRLAVTATATSKKNATTRPAKPASKGAGVSLKNVETAPVVNGPPAETSPTPAEITPAESVLSPPEETQNPKNEATP